ncbi:ubiquitin-associated protein 2 isoform X2 [Sigmodon hispidus]
MTLVSNDRCRGAREKPQVPATHTAQPQKQLIQATAEQMRLAQVIFDKNDSDFEAKVKQLMEETVGAKKKNFGKESSENKENREKRSERETSRGRGNSNPKGRGGYRGREFKGKEYGIDCNQGDKPSERGKWAGGGGRGFGRGRGRGAGRFSAQSMGTFNPADYSESASTDGCGTKLVAWETAQNGTDEGIEGIAKPHSISQELPNTSSYGLKGAWKNSVKEWTSEDWAEDLSETKVFTASSVPAENHITPGQSIDLVALLQKPVPPSQAAEANSFETSQQQGFGQALVFTNSQHNTQPSPGTGSSTSANAFSPQSLSSILGSGFGELAPSKMVNISSSQILDKLKAKHRESTPGDGPSSVNRLLQLPNMGVENIVSAHQPQPKHIKLPKRRIPQAKHPQICLQGCLLCYTISTSWALEGCFLHIRSTGMMSSRCCSHDCRWINMEFPLQHQQPLPAQAPNKSAGSGPGKRVSASSGTTGLPEMSASVYNKTQTFDKQGFHTGTPPPFSLPSALGSTGPLAAGAAPGYAPAPFLHIMSAHQQPHTQLHHHLP